MPAAPRRTSPTKRLLDVAVCIATLPLGVVIVAVVAPLIAVTSPGPVIHWSIRIGHQGRAFRMPKLRTMRAGTPEVATELLQDPQNRLTPVGRLLRLTSIDEIPQLWSILRGDMSLVGPRPALFNQHELIRRRKELGIDALRPGLTGWAQINGRDHASEERKVELDAEYLSRASLAFDAWILLLTAWRVVRRDGVAH
jgi:O-antigen biosynthesis protein WbqP